MADNVQLNVGSGGDVIAADDISGTKYQIVKLALGKDGVVDKLVSATDPIPTTALDYFDVWNPWSVTSGASPFTDSEDHTLRAADPPGGSQLELLFIGSIYLANEDGDTPTRVYLKNGSSTILLSFYLPAGASITYRCSPLIFGGVDTDLDIQCVTTGAAVTVNVQGYAAIIDA